MHCLFVDNMIHSSTSDDLCDKLICEYQADFDIILEDVMSSFLGMEIDHNKRDFTIHLDTYIKEILTEYKATACKVPSSGPLHWAALHHVLGYLEEKLETPSFKLSYQLGGFYALDGFTDSD